MSLVVALAVIAAIVFYVNYRLAATNLNREEIEEAEKHVKNFSDNSDFRKM
jgi:hypothetical protein